MGDRDTLAKARQELEELYLGVPDESVDLTFKDMVSFQQKSPVPEKKGSNMEPIDEEPKTGGALQAPGKSPRLDSVRDSPTRTHQLGRHAVNGEVYRELVVRSSFKRNTAKGSPRSMQDQSHACEDMSGHRRTSRSPHDERAGGRRRPGIPHSKICTLCSVSIYIFRHRCLVCGRAYCRQCVGVGMGEMTEGRKCIDCLGMRFSQRYIRRAGRAGCCCWRSRYPTAVTLQELNWAEKGPRRGGERVGYERSGIISEYSKTSTVGAATTARAAAPLHVMSTCSQASFVDASRAWSPPSPGSAPTRSPRSRGDGAASFVASTAHPPTVYATPF